MEKIPHDENYQNSYAKLENGDEVYVRYVRSGKQGYYCLGCGKEMIANHSKSPTRKWYFRHHVHNVVKEQRCTYSDETHRHKLAKEFIQQLGEIRLPAVYKFPHNKDGWAYLISKPTTLRPYRIAIETYFYEDGNGLLCYGKKSEIGERHCIVKPDVTFFDKNDKPILFIEFAATHKVNKEKLRKLRQLQINTIEITIPDSSPEDIAKALKTTSNTIWLYNHEEYTTEYIHISRTSTEGVQFADGDQRKFFEETLSCRTTQIGELIRKVNRYMGTEHYSQNARTTAEEIHRIGVEADKNYQLLRELQSECRREVEEEFRNEIDRIESEENQFERYYRDLEGRYIGKREKLRGTTIQVSRDINATELRKGRASKGREDLRVQLAGITESIERERNNIAELGNEESKANERIRNPRKQVDREYREIEKRHTDGFKNFKESEGRAIDQLKGDIERAQADFKAALADLNAGDEEIRRRIAESIENRANITERGAGALQGLLDEAAFLPHFKEVQFNLRRYRKAKEYFDAKDYEIRNE